MSHENRKKALLKKHNLSGVNKPKRTPGHKTKSHMVLAQVGHQLKLIRFGQKFPFQNLDSNLKAINSSK